MFQSMENDHSLRSIPDDELLQRLARLMDDSRRVEADLVAHIGEVDERKLFLREASPSMFCYCTDVLHLSEAEAYLRITAARASRRHPVLLAMLRDGRLHLSGRAKLAPHLTPENRDLLLTRATHRSKSEIEKLLAELYPRPDAPSRMRRLPTRHEIPLTAAIATNSSPTAPAASDGAPGHNLAAPQGQLRPDRARDPAPAPELPMAHVEPLAPGRYKVQFTASAELHDKLERLQALMRAKVPDGDVAAIIDHAVTETLERLEARRFAVTKAPRSRLSEADISPRTRRIPAAVRRVVHARDGGRCRYVDEHGRRCTAREGLEYHHCRPFGFGGDHSPENVRLMCRGHNRFLAELDYGVAAMGRHRRSSKDLLASSPPSPGC
jgi:hypothetical protein